MKTVGTSDLGALSLVELEAELATLASHIYAGTCRWLELVGELDRRGGWAEAGGGSCAEWLAWRCAVSPRAAREHVRVARCLPELPLIHAAFARGELSYAKVRALTRVATAGSEEDLLRLARAATAAQLERTVRAYRRVTTEEARELQERAQLSVFWNPDGSLELHGQLAPEDGALLLRALDAIRDSLWKQAGGSAEPRPARQASNAEALVAVAEAALAQPEREPAGRGALPGGRARRPGRPLRRRRGRLRARGRQRPGARDSAQARLRRVRRPQRAQDAHDPARAATSAAHTRPRLPFPRLREPPIPRRPPRPSLGERRPDDARQPRLALPPPPPT